MLPPGSLLVHSRRCLAVLAVLFVTTGAPVASQRPPPRILSLVPGASRLLVELGVGDRVVGRTDADHTPSLQGTPSVGHVLEPDLERVVALDPSLILVWADGERAGVERVAEVIGAEVVPIRLDRLRELAPTTRKLGRLVNRAGAARALVRRIRRDLEGLTVPARDRPLRVLWVVWPDPAIVAGPETLPADLMAVLGVENVVAGMDRRWPRPSWEWLVSRDADVVIWPVGPGQPPLDSLSEGSPWRAVPAVARGQVVEPELDLVHEVGPRIPEAAALLARLLTPFFAEAPEVHP